MNKGPARAFILKAFKLSVGSRTDYCITRCLGCLGCLGTMERWRPGPQHRHTRYISHVLN